MGLNPKLSIDYYLQRQQWLQLISIIIARLKNMRPSNFWDDSPTARYLGYNISSLNISSYEFTFLNKYRVWSILE